MEEYIDKLTLFFENNDIEVNYEGVRDGVYYLHLIVDKYDVEDIEDHLKDLFESFCKEYDLEPDFFTFDFEVAHEDMYSYDVNVFVKINTYNVNDDFGYVTPYYSRYYEKENEDYDDDEEIVLDFPNIKPEHNFAFLDLQKGDILNAEEAYDRYLHEYSKEVKRDELPASEIQDLKDVEGKIYTPLNSEEYMKNFYIDNLTTLSEKEEFLKECPEFMSADVLDNEEKRELLEKYYKI